MAFRSDLRCLNPILPKTPGEEREMLKQVYKDSTTELHWRLFHPSLPREGQEQKRLCGFAEGKEQG